ncbi:MAG: hypothetical protein AB1730_12825 [Myxococcota bacterium]|jgi:hypothetical protein
MNRALFSSVVMLLVAACEAEIVRKGPDDPTIIPVEITAKDASRIQAPEVALCDSGRTYVGFGGTELTADRRQVDLGLETVRLKPFSALQTEYPRVLGNTPGLLAGAESTFGTTPARWFPAPQASAVTMYTAYRIAFQGCLTLTAQPAKYAVEATQETAMAECAVWAKKFWSRPALGPEIEACASLIRVDAASETNVRRRWAYGCAAVLTASDFMTY